MGTDVPSRLAPTTTPDTAFFWEGVPTSCC